MSVVRLPFDPDVVIPALLEATGAPGSASMPASRSASWTPRGSPDDDRAAAGRRLGRLPPCSCATCDGRLLGPLARHLGGDDPTLRASLAASRVAGMAFTRHVVGLPRLASASRDELVGALGPVLEHYLVGDWSPQPR